jgi:hypothetical protein
LLLEFIDAYRTIIQNPTKWRYTAMLGGKIDEYKRLVEGRAHWPIALHGDKLGTLLKWRFSIWSHVCKTRLKVHVRCSYRGRSFSMQIMRWVLLQTTGNSWGGWLGRLGSGRFLFKRIFGGWNGPWLASAS